MNVNKSYVINDPLAAIYNEGHWRLCKVSPLLNLQYSAVKFKQYASKVLQAIVSTISANSELKYSVLLEPQPYLKFCEDDPNGFTIAVSSSRENKSIVVYTSIFLSWGENIKVENTVHLPFMLERGDQRIGTAVQTSLQNMFDCNIKQFHFTQEQLLQFGFNLIDYDTSRSTDPFTFCYQTQGDHKNRLDLTFEVGDINIIWNGVKEALSNTSAEQVKLAYQILQNQMFHTIKLDVTALCLCEVNLSKAEVKSNGIIKMKTPEIVNCVFTVLNEILSTYTIDINDTTLQI